MRALRQVILLTACATLGFGSTSPLVEQSATAFAADADGVHCHRIPSLVTAKDGSLVLACESRKLSWRDKSPTDVVVRRSADGGRTWSATQVVMDGGDDACMDPCLVADRVSGRVFLFATRWPAKDHSTRGNTAWLATSDDGGATWSKPEDVSRTHFPAGSRVNGFGSGSGLQLTETSPWKGRLIAPVRLLRDSVFANVAIWSDDHGSTWQVGEGAAIAGEFQIAELGGGRLIANDRDGAERRQFSSVDGGRTWSAPEAVPDIPPVANGCHASVLGIGKVLLYTGPAGSTPEKGYDNRGRLTLRRSLDGGKTWPESMQLDDRAAGYSCLTRLNDGRIAVVFETTETPTFVRGDAGRHWIRLDVLALSARITDPAQPLGTR